MLTAITSGLVHVVSAESDLRAETIGALARNRTLPPHLFYGSEACAAAWSRLSRANGYQTRSDSLALFAEQSAALASAIEGQLGEDWDLVSLGPGDGHKEALLIRENASSNRYPVRRFVPVDVSPSLIAQTMTSVGAIAGDRLAIEAIVSRFDDLPTARHLVASAAPLAVLLLGNTIGNFADELELLRLVRLLMKAGDILVVEISLRTSASEEVRGLGDLELNRAFNFAPLADLGVPYQSERLTYRVEEGRGTIAGSHTVVASYTDLAVGDMHVAEADLALVHRYQLYDFVSSVTAIGFETAGPVLRGESGRTAVVCFRREERATGRRR